MSDLQVIWPGQVTTAQVHQSALRTANEMLDELTLERQFIYTTPDAGATWSKLLAFPDLTTTYTFAPGNLKLLRKGLAVKMAPSVKTYMKNEGMLAEVAKEAAEAKAALKGVGIVGVV